MIKKTVLVVGATSGIGKEIVKKFAKSGYDIFATFNNGNIEEIEKICKEYNSNLFSFSLNVKDGEIFESLFKKVEKEVDYLDCAVYCSGISFDEKLLIDVEREEIDNIIDVNLKGAIYFGREAMRFFSRKKYGSIIFISSIYGIYGGACESVYSASKGGLIALTKAMSLECGNFNVKVNCVAPGFIETKMTEKFNDEEREQIKINTPLNRLGSGEDVADAVAFLASEDASFITGQVIEVAGGACRF